jgi:hypothetical protein
MIIDITLKATMPLPLMDKGDSEGTTGEGLLNPLCRLYGALAVTDDIHSNQQNLEESNHHRGFDPSWNLQGSLLTAGLNPSIFPRFKMFARLTRLITIEMKDGRNARDALGYALRAVLPFYTLTPTGISTIEVNKRTCIYVYVVRYVCKHFFYICIWI